MIFPKPYADAVAKLRMPLGFVMVAAFLWFSDPNTASLAAGVPVSLAGLALRAWAAGHLQKDRTLAQSGPYGHVRNPLYLGTLTVAAGVAIASRKWELAVLFAAVFGLAYLPAVELEEQHLSGLFPEFVEYSQKVPRLWPRLSSAMASHGRFRWEGYRRNREYQALMGYAAGLAVLAWKALRA